MKKLKREVVIMFGSLTREIEVDEDTAKRLDDGDTLLADEVEIDWSDVINCIDAEIELA